MNKLFKLLTLSTVMLLLVSCTSASEEVKEVQKDSYEELDELKLGKGTYIAGNDIDSGIYDVIFEGSGGYLLKDKSGAVMEGEIVGSRYGTDRYRAVIPEGYTVKISSLSATFMEAEDVSTFEGDYIDLYPGTWFSATDIPLGGYTAKPINGRKGNIIVLGPGDNVSRVNEIIGGIDGLESIELNLKGKEIIKISGLNIRLTPLN